MPMRFLNVSIAPYILKSSNVWFLIQQKIQERLIIKRLSTLSFCFGIAFLSALFTRNQLQFNDLNGSQLFSVAWFSLDLKYIVNTGINFGLASNDSNARN